MPELPQLILALAAFALAASLVGALRRAGRRAFVFAGLITADLSLCGLALRQDNPSGLLLWAALGGVVLLVVLPRLFAEMQGSALRSGNLERAWRLQRWRSFLQPGTHGAGLLALEQLCAHRAPAREPEDPRWASSLLRSTLEPALRLAVLEAAFTDLAKAGRAEELLALLEAEGSESLLAVSPRIAAIVLPVLAAGSGQDQTSAAPPRVGTREPVHRQAPVSLLLLLGIAAVHLLVILLGSSDETATLLRFGGNYPALSLHGEPWRLLASVFLHGGLLHLGVNAYALYGLGRFVEPFYGSLRLFVIFVVSGLFGSSASALLGHADRLSVGASGAIFGLLGAALMALLTLRGMINERWRRQVLFNLLIIIALNLWIGYSVKVVDNWAHLGGLGGGLAIGLLLAPRPSRPVRRATLAAVRVLAGLLLAAIAGTALAVAVTPSSRSIGRLPWQTVEHGPVSLDVPASTTADPDTRAVVLRDPLLRIGLLTADVDLVSAQSSIDEELTKREEALRDELRDRYGLLDVVPLSPDALPPRLGPPGTAQAGLRFPLEGEPFVQLLLVRRQDDVLLQMRVAVPAARLNDMVPVLRRIFGSLRYRKVSGPGT